MTYFAERESEKRRFSISYAKTMKSLKSIIFSFGTLRCRKAIEIKMISSRLTNAHVSSFILSYSPDERTNLIAMNSANVLRNER